MESNRKRIYHEKVISTDINVYNSIKFDAVIDYKKPIAQCVSINYFAVKSSSPPYSRTSHVRKYEAIFPSIQIRQAHVHMPTW